MPATSSCMRVALVSLTVGTAFFLLGFATPSWLSSTATFINKGDGKEVKQHLSVGLWTRNYPEWEEDFYEKTVYSRFNSGWFGTVQTVECIGLILLIPSLILLFLYAFIPSMKNSFILLINLALTFSAVFFIMMGIEVLGLKTEEITYTQDNQLYLLMFHADWSMGMAILGGIILFVSGVMQVMERCEVCR